MSTETQDDFFQGFKPFVVPVKKAGTTKVYSAEYNKERKAHKRAAKEVEKDLTWQPKDLWNKFNDQLNKTISELETSLKTILQSKNYLYTQLRKHENSINDFSNMSFFSVINSSNPGTLSFFKHKESFANLENFKIAWQGYLIVNQRFYTIKDKINTCKRRQVPYKVWFRIIKQFNTSISKAIIEDGYELHMGYGLTLIRIQRRIRNNPEIDNPASFQKRKAIVARGEIPYNEKTHPEGEKWRCYRTDRYKFEWYWSKKAISVKNAYYYTFFPTTGKIGNVKALYEYIEANPNHTIKYKY